MLASQAKVEPQRTLRKKYRTKFYDIKDGYKLVAFINKIPNLQQIKFKLSEEECQIVGQNENLIVIGRSGSGKTTCALMRLFSIQILHTNLNARNRHLEQQRNGKYQCTPDLIDEKFGIRNIFLTASAFLITTIQSKYDELVLHVKKELSKKMVLKGVKIEASKMKQLGEDLSSINRKNLQRDEKYQSFDSLDDSDFPGFFTIREFLIMMDGSLINHFFMRDATGKRIQNLKAIYIGNEDKQFQIKQKDLSYFAKECKWQQFQQKFWHRNLNSIKQLIRQKQKYSSQSQGKHRQITAIIVWTQIYSTIKGEFEAHKYPEKYLPLKKYLELSKNKTFKAYQKQAIYQIFLMYEAWKSRQIVKYYDLLDLTNHLLVYIRQFYDYMNMNHLFMNEQPPQFHYLFLDQVQDLPPSVPYLISMVFSDGVYFSGDSAQAIQKGVSFKFGDIKYMFKEQLPLPPLNFQNPKQHKLTVNFRSHQNILNFANIVTQILIKIFPKSIDPLKQQQSQIKGPKPILLGFGHQQTIKALVERKGANAHEQCQTAIIIRNHEVQLSQQMKKLDYLVLTVQQSKGMEFRDVIMYGFFQPKRQYLWKILKCLDIFPQRGLKQFRKQDFDTEDYLQLITELKQLYTLVTRTKCSLIMCENMPAQLEAILYNKNIIYNYRDVGKMLQDIQKYRNQMINLSFFSWEDRGYQFQINHQYELALKCYRKSTNQNKCIQIQAILLHRRALTTMQSLKDRYNITKLQLQLTQEQLNNHPSFQVYKTALLKHVWPQQKQAGERYKQIKFYLQAGDCFILIEDYEQALSNYRLQKQDGKIYYKLAICYENIVDQKKNNLRLAAKYYGLSKSYHEMLEILEKLNDYKELIKQIKLINDFPYKQYYYRNAAKRIMLKQYDSIDKMLNKNQIKLQTIKYHFSHSQFVQTQMNLFNFQARLDRFKTIFSFRQKIYNSLQKLSTQIFWYKNQLQITKSELNQYNSFKINMTKIKHQQIQDLQRSIKTYEQNLMNYSSFSFRQNQSSFSQRYDYSPFSLRQFSSYSSRQKQSYKILIKQIQIQQILSYLKFDQLNIEKLSIFHQQWEFQGILQKIIELNLLTQKNIRFHQNIQKEAEELLNELNVFPFIRGNKILIKNKIIASAQEIFQHIQKFYTKISETIQKLQAHKSFIANKKIQNLQKVYADYSSLVQWLLDYSTFKQALKQQFTNYQSIYLKQFYALLDKENKRLNAKVLEEIHSKVESSNYQHILLFDEYNQRLDMRISKQINIFEKGVCSYLDMDLQLFQNVDNRMIVQLEQIDDPYQFLSFQYISQLSLQNAYRQSNKSKNLIDLIPKMQVICPRAVMGLASSLFSRYKSVDYLLAQLTTQSSIYQNKNSFDNFVPLPQQPMTKSKEKSKRILSLINLNYFNFQLQRTRLRRQIATNQFVQGLVLLGLQKICQDMLDDSLIFRLDMKQLNYSKYTLIENSQKLNKNNGKLTISIKQSSFQVDSNSEQVWQLRSRLLIDEFIKMDKQENNCWYSSNRQNRNYYNLMDKNGRQDIDRFIIDDISLKKKNIKRQKQDLKQKIKSQVQNSSQLYNSKLKYYSLDFTYPMFNTNLDSLKTQQLANIFSNLIKQHQIIFQQIRRVIFNDLEYAIRMLEIYTRNILDLLGFVKQKMINSHQKKHLAIYKFQTFTKEVVNMKLKLMQLNYHQIDKYDQQWDRIFSNLPNYVTDNQYIKSLENRIRDNLKLQHLIQDIRNHEYYSQFLRQSQQLSFLKNKQKYILQKKNQYLQLQKEQKFVQQLQKLKHNSEYYRYYIRAEYYIPKLQQIPLNRLYNKSINLLQLIYCKQSSRLLYQYLCEILTAMKTSRSIQEKKYFEIQLILSCFSLANYDRDRNYRRDTQLIQSSQVIFSKVFESLQNPQLDEDSFSLYCAFLYIFKANVIRNSVQMSIFSYLVLVNHSSPLLQATAFKPNTIFCHYINSDRQVLLMKLENVSQLITQKIYKDREGRAYNPPILNNYSAFANLGLVYEIEAKTTKIRDILQNIMREREQLLEFYYNSCFVGSQSFLFVYHQLKNYYDLIQTTRLVKPPISPNFENYLKTSVDLLSKQFREWRAYTKQLEILKKRVKYI